MPIHKNNFGSFANDIQTDINGYIPIDSDEAFDLDYDHGCELTHDENGELTEYGDWFENDRFPEIKANAKIAIRKAERGITKCQK